MRLKTDIDTTLVRTAAARTMRWPFRMWAFGEAVALRGLLQASELTGDAEPLGFVRALLRAFVGRGVGRGADDHVAPGTELLLLHARDARDAHDAAANGGADGDSPWLSAAEALADLHAHLPLGPHGVRYPRHNLPGWREQIWVDSMSVAPPFLARLAAVTGRGAHATAAVTELLAYCRLLQDERSGVLIHGHEAHCGRNGQHWARGNGWAALGLADTLSLLPAGFHHADGHHPDSDVSELRQRLSWLFDGLSRVQDESGLWHTVVDGEDTPLETTLAVMIVCAIDRAERAGAIERGRFTAMRDRARAAALAHVSPATGELALVSDATPIGERRMYATRPFGIFPWGQGPLLLMLTDAAAS